MTETTEPQIITDVVELIDGALGTFGHRELVSSGEVTDVLLDVRSMLRGGDFTPIDTNIDAKVDAKLATSSAKQSAS